MQQYRYWINKPLLFHYQAHTFNFCSTKKPNSVPIGNEFGFSTISYLQSEEVVLSFSAFRCQFMDRFKMQAAQKVGVNLTNGYNGQLTSREAGSVGGQMVKKMCPVRTSKYNRQSRTAMGHMQEVQYITSFSV